MSAPSPPAAPGRHTELQERLIAFAVTVWRLTRHMAREPTMAGPVDQVVRSATSAAANYAEACAAESRRDFIHKMQICLKELRETQVWIEILRRTARPDGIGPVLQECDELTAIFVSSIRTARRRL